MVLQVPTIQRRIKRDLEVASIPEVRRLIRDALADAGGGLAGEAVVTVPPGFEVTETVAAVGVTPASRIVLSLAPALSSDENEPEMIDLMGASATAGSGQITITASFGTLTSGPVKFNWSAF